MFESTRSSGIKKGPEPRKPEFPTPPKPDTNITPIVEERLISREKPEGSTDTHIRERGTDHWRGSRRDSAITFDIKGWFKRKKKKRKFKNGDYRLTPQGRVLAVTVIPFFISVAIFLACIASGNDLILVTVGGNALFSAAACFVTLIVGIKEGIDDEFPLSVWIASAFFTFPAIVAFLLASAVAVSFEKVGEQPPMKGVPEPQRGPQPPSYKLMPDGHTLYGPEPKTPPRAPLVPKEKPEGSTGAIRIV